MTGRSAGSGGPPSPGARWVADGCAETIIAYVSIIPVLVLAAVVATFTSLSWWWALFIGGGIWLLLLQIWGRLKRRRRGR